VRLHRFVVLVVFTFLTATASAQSLRIETLAGSTTGGGHIDAAGTLARFSLPRSVDSDAAGNLYVADTANHVIRRVTPNGVVTTIAGVPNQAGSSDGFGAAARFRYPIGITVDRPRNIIYVADSYNHTIRRVTPDGLVTTFAGAAGVAGTADGNAATARFTYPLGLAVDAAGNVFVADTSNHVIRRITPQGEVTKIAGIMRSSGSSDGFGSQAMFNFPYDIAFDATSGNFYVSDTQNSTIRKLTPDGRVTTFAGNPLASGDEDGIGAEALFADPWGLAVDAAGNVYVADHDNDKIRKITPAAVVTTYAGTGFSGSNNGPAGSARFSDPSGLAVLPDGTTIVVSDGYNHALRLIANAQVTTLAGSMPVHAAVNATGTSARFHYPYGVAIDAAGNAYVTESSCAIRKITPQGVVTTFAGTPGESGSRDGQGTSARFSFPKGIAIDRNGNLYVADTGNHTIRKITPQGLVTTLAGSAGEFGDTDGSGSQARFFEPWGVVADPQGNIFVTDTSNHSIRIVEPAGVVTTFAGDGIAGHYDGVGSIASFRYPTGIAIDGARNLYVGDWGNRVVRKITPAGSVTTIAGKPDVVGGDDGVGSNATFDTPNFLVSDAGGNLYVSDEYNHTIRRVSSDGTVTTVAGLHDTPGNVNGTGSAARFSAPQGLALTPQGALVIVDLLNHAVRIGTFALPSIERFEADPSRISTAGQIATLTWSVRDATSVTIDQGIGTVLANGSRAVTPSTTTTYTITATGPGGTVTRSVTVYVGAAGKRRSARH
jgi:sugar lactone lactonase YvrE